MNKLVKVEMQDAISGWLGQHNGETVILDNKNKLTLGKLIYTNKFPHGPIVQVSGSTWLHTFRPESIIRIIGMTIVADI